MLVFSTLYETACKRKGGEESLAKLLHQPFTPSELSTIPDQFYLSELCKKIFQSGFVWRVVENKWDNFEALFWNFDVDRLIMSQTCSNNPASA